MTQKNCIKMDFSDLYYSMNFPYFHSFYPWCDTFDHGLMAKWMRIWKVMKLEKFIFDVVFLCDVSICLVDVDYF